MRVMKELLKIKILKHDRQLTVFGDNGGFQKVNSFGAEGLPSLSISSIVGKFASSWKREKRNPDAMKKKEQQHDPITAKQPDWYKTPTTSILPLHAPGDWPKLQ